MKCCGSDLNPSGGFIRCQEDGPNIIWCPTWCKSWEGPQNFCNKHGEIHLKNEKGDGNYFYGDDAKTEYFKIQLIIPAADERYEGVKGMLHGQFSSHVAGRKNPSTFTNGCFVVDGRLWLLTGYLAMHIGAYADVKDKYQKLLSEPKRD